MSQLICCPTCGNSAHYVGGIVRCLTCEAGPAVSTPPPAPPPVSQSRPVQRRLLGPPPRSYAGVLTAAGLVVAIGVASIPVAWIVLNHKPPRQVSAGESDSSTFHSVSARADVPNRRRKSDEEPSEAKPKQMPLAIADAQVEPPAEKDEPIGVASQRPKPSAELAAVAAADAKGIAPEIPAGDDEEVGAKPPAAADGTIACVKKYLDENLDDPTGLQFVSWSGLAAVTYAPGDPTPYWGVRVKYRAKNPFGTLRLTTAIFFIQNGEVERVIDDLRYDALLIDLWYPPGTFPGEGPPRKSGRVEEAEEVERRVDDFLDPATAVPLPDDAGGKVSRTKGRRS